MKAAGSVRRLLAVSVDATFGLVIVAAGLTFGLLDSTGFDVEPGWFWTEWYLKSWLDAPSLYVNPVIVFLVANVMWTLAWELAGGNTPGAIATGLEVVDEEADRPHPVRSLVRAAGIVLDILTLGLGWMWGLVSPSRRALHDVLSGTRVVISGS